MTEIKRKQYYLNSKDATYIADDTNWLRFDFSGVPFRAQKDEYITVTVSQVVIPVSWHNVNSYNNKIYWTDLATSPTTLTTTLTTGNYTNTTFITMLQTVIRATSSYFSTATVTEDTTNSKFIVTLNTTHWSTLYINNSTTTAKYLLGIAMTGYTTVTPNAAYTFANVYDLTYTKCIYIVSNDMYNYNSDSNSQSISSNILASAMINVNNPNVLCINTFFENRLVNPAINMFEIQLQDEDRNLLIMNGVHWQIVLDAKIYKRNDALEEINSIYKLEQNNNNKRKLSTANLK